MYIIILALAQSFDISQLDVTTNHDFSHLFNTCISSIMLYYGSEACGYNKYGHIRYRAMRFFIEFYKYVTIVGV